jgi:hypothetical protein
MSDPYEGVREPAPERAGLVRGIFDPSPIELVAEGLFLASEHETHAYVERFGDRYRWSLVHKGGPYPLLRITARFLQMDYTALIIAARSVLDGYSALTEDEDDPAPDACAIVHLEWCTMPDAAAALVREAIG